VGGKGLHLRRRPLTTCPEARTVGSVWHETPAEMIGVSRSPHARGDEEKSTEISHRGLQKYDDQHDTAPNCLAQGLQIEPRFGASRNGSSAVLCGMRAVAGCSISIPDRAAGAGALPKRYCCLGGPPERRLLSQGECVIWPYGCKPLRLPRRSRPGRHARNGELILPPETKRGDGRLWSRVPVGSTNRLSSDRLDWCDNTLCRFNDLAGIET
jgi:hypothetical protein